MAIGNINQTYGGYKRTPFCQAAWDKDYRCLVTFGITFSREQPAALKVRDTSGYSPLMWASYRGHLPSVKFILANRLEDEISSKNAWGKTALSYAKKHPDIVQYLTSKHCYTKCAIYMILHVYFVPT